MLRRASNCRLEWFTDTFGAMSDYNAHLQNEEWHRRRKLRRRLGTGRPVAVFWNGKQEHLLPMTESGYLRILKLQTKSPQAVYKIGDRNYWLFRGQMWWEDQGLDS